MITPSMQEKFNQTEQRERLNQFAREHRAQRHVSEHRTLSVVSKLFASLNERITAFHRQPVVQDQKRTTAEIRGI